MLRVLPKKYFLILRRFYFSAKASTKSIQRLYLGTFSSNELKLHLESRLDNDFEVLMVHSSLNGMSTTYTGDASELVRTLIEFCGPDRTLVMPAFYFGNPDVGSLTETFAQNPRFDIRRTPSQMGLATEIFRRWKGVVQSRHPVYRVSALGPLAKALTQGHEFADGPAGAGSPFEFMASRKTLILGIGKSFDVMTQTHHVEGIMKDSFPIPITKNPDIKVILCDQIGETPVSLVSYQVQSRFNISKLPKLLNKNELNLWKFHGVSMFSANAANVTKSLIKSAKSGQTLYDDPVGSTQK